MTETELSQNALAVGRLDFVDLVTFLNNVPLVFVELSPRLISILPAEYHALLVLRDSLTVGHVISRYERYIEQLKRLGYEEAMAVATEMLKTAQIQTTKL